jgi:hypothetical protein
MRNPMTCPYLKEVVMLYCDACPFKKMVPFDHLVSVSPCIAQEYQTCRHFMEAVATQAGAAPRKEGLDPHAAPLPASKGVT